MCFSTNPCSRICLSSNNLSWKAALLLKWNIKGLEKAKVGFLCALLRSQTLPSSSLEMLLWNPLRVTLPSSTLTTRPGGFCFPCLEPGALANPMRYSVTKFPCKFEFAKVHQLHAVCAIASEDLPIHSTSFAFSGVFFFPPEMFSAQQRVHQNVQQILQTGTARVYDSMLCS